MNIKKEIFNKLFSLGFVDISIVDKKKNPYLFINHQLSIAITIESLTIKNITYNSLIRITLRVTKDKKRIDKIYRYRIPIRQLLGSFLNELLFEILI